MRSEEAESFIYLCNSLMNFEVTNLGIADSGVAHDRGVLVAQKNVDNSLYRASTKKVVWTPGEWPWQWSTDLHWWNACRC